MSADPFTIGDDSSEDGEVKTAGMSPLAPGPVALHDDDGGSDGDLSAMRGDVRVRVGGGQADSGGMDSAAGAGDDDEDVLSQGDDEGNGGGDGGVRRLGASLIAPKDTVHDARLRRGDVGDVGVMALCPGCTVRACCLGAAFIVAITIVIAVLAKPGTGSDEPTPLTDSHAVTHFVSGDNGVVASTNYLASQAGLDALKAGGNAVDAAAVVQFMLNVLQPESTGIGGGCLPLVYMASTGTVHAFDGREEAPAAFNESAFCKTAACDEALPFFLERATGGTLAAVATVLERFGTFTLAQALQPAIDAARNGVPMTSHLHNQIEINKERLDWFQGTRGLLLNDDGTAPIAAIGETWTNHDLARTFELIADQGIEAFYDGPIGHDVVAAVQAAKNPLTNQSGLMVMDDLRGYKAVERTPTSVSFNGYTVYGQAGPSSGGLTAGLVLNMLEGLHVDGMVANRLPAIKAFVDTMNIAWADREYYMADMDWADVPVEGLLNKTYARNRRDALMKVATAVETPVAPGQPNGAPPLDAAISGRRRRLTSKLGGAPTSDVGAPPGHTPSSTFHSLFSDWSADKHGTTHFSIIDKDRNVVSWTTTVEENLGSAVVVPGRGFVLNNELTDFSALPYLPGTNIKAANRPEGGKKPRRTALGTDATSLGGKRPMSSMNPTIVLDSLNRPYLAVGSPGGATIISTTLNVLLNVVTHDMSLREATEAARTVTRNGQEVIMEHGLTTDLALMKQCFDIGISVTDTWGSRPLGFVETAQVVYARDSDTVGTLHAGADNRLDSAGAFAY